MLAIFSSVGVLRVKYDKDSRSSGHGGAKQSDICAVPYNKHMCNAIITTFIIINIYFA